ncbi:MAG: hypothetical protein R2865_11815 [Deinococcales bacterium]
MELQDLCLTDISGGLGDYMSWVNSGLFDLAKRLKTLASIKSPDITLTILP